MSDFVRIAQSDIFNMDADEEFRDTWARDMSYSPSQYLGMLKEDEEYLKKRFQNTTPKPVFTGELRLPAPTNEQGKRHNENLKREFEKVEKYKDEIDGKTKQTPSIKELATRASCIYLTNAGKYFLPCLDGRNSVKMVDYRMGQSIDLPVRKARNVRFEKSFDGSGLMVVVGIDF
jgi:hypothetical protein